MVPKERRFDSFIFPKSLEKDESFRRGSMRIIDLVLAEKDNFEDVSHAWQTLKDALKVWGLNEVNEIFEAMSIKNIGSGISCDS